MCPTGGNHKRLREYAEVWGIRTDRFDPGAASYVALRRVKRPLSEILVRDSTFNRGHLKRRLFAEGMKKPICELCGQGGIWNGRRMTLILDHVNGVSDDHRLENLRIVCPNCAATLDTHCGRQNRLALEPQRCAHCGAEFRPSYTTQRYCSRYCGSRSKGDRSPKPHLRKVARPPYTHLLREIKALGYCGAGRRYGVSDNAIRKWIRQYERELAAADGKDEGPDERLRPAA
jgi:hypothetical protein